MPRPLVPSLRRSPILPLATLLGGAIAAACGRGGQESATAAPEKSTTPAASSSTAMLASATPSVSSSSTVGMANPTEPETIVAVASTATAVASCTAKVHTTPHIMPAPTNHMLGGKPMPVNPYP